VLVGLPTVLLSRPNVPYNINPNEVVPIEKPVPYWYLMAPDRSTYCGWLPVEKVEKLHQRLLVGQHMLEEDLRTRIELPPNVSAANAHISPDLNPDYWYERIPIVYQQAVEMMSQAEDAGVGLFSIVYQAYGDPEEWGDETDEDQS
ncbi:MAG: hypothetical protein WA029_10335, partial [Anaerolineae bacterium]